jgi:hypothetical protein
VRTADPVPISALQIEFGQLPTEKFSFGMRFSRNTTRRSSSVSLRLSPPRIDFEQALASGKTVVTCGRIGSDLNFEIQGVSVE